MADDHEPPSADGPPSAEGLPSADEVRCEAALQTIKDVLWRFDESSDGTYTLYDILGFVVEDLVKEGCCAACISETMAAAFQQSGANPTEHKPEGDAVYHCGLPESGGPL